MPKKTLGILFGGASTEHEVSLRSAASVAANCPEQEYEPVLIGIDKDGRWYHYTGSLEDMAAGRWLESGKATPARISPDAAHHGLLLEDGRLLRLDVVFPVLHGKNGEDGTMQGLFELAGIPYVGCGVLASAACMDKCVTKLLCSAAGIPNAPWLQADATTLQSEESFFALQSQVAEKLGYPVFVKPANSGSSVGVCKVAAPEGLRPALEEALRYDAKLLIEQAIVGQEVEAAVMGNQEPVAAQVVGEIAPTHEFYDYEGKYLDDSTQLYIPARISEFAAQEVRRLAVAAYRALGCQGFARIDFFVCSDGGVVLNEINTIPGFTSISMFPKLFMASGLEYPEIVRKLVALAFQKQEG